MVVKPKRIVISGYYGFGNTGDEAVLAGILATFKQVGIDAEVTVLSADPARTMAEHPNVISIHRYSPAALIKAIHGADLLISGGGSLFQDVTSARSVRYYLFVLQLAHLLGRKSMIYAQGVGPLVRPGIRSAVARTLNRVSVITVRDPESKALLEEIDVKRPPVRLSADPSFMIEPDLDTADRIIDEAGLTGKPVIGVSLRPWKETGQWLRHATRGIEEACAQLGVTPAIIPMQEAEDVPMCETIKGGVTLRGGGRPRVIKGIISRCGLVVGMRLHALILATGEGVPFVPIVYDPKVASFASVVSRVDSVDIDSLEAEPLRDVITAAWSEREARASRLIRKASELKRMAMISGEAARELLG
ncbi:MAG: polysaccharide pyruvyl transferase CsaB [Armatimonadetes bacterium]|nr:polysaccharide pyruvyl transferase CsaB [Armatimonadota bacterium]